MKENATAGDAIRPIFTKTAENLEKHLEFEFETNVLYSSDVQVWCPSKVNGGVFKKYVSGIVPIFIQGTGEQQHERDNVVIMRL